MFSLSSLISEFVEFSNYISRLWRLEGMAEAAGEPHIAAQYADEWAEMDLHMANLDRSLMARQVVVIPVRQPEELAELLTRPQYISNSTVIWPTSWPTLSDGFVAHRSTL